MDVALPGAARHGLKRRRGSQVFQPPHRRGLVVLLAAAVMAVALLVDAADALSCVETPCGQNTECHELDAANTDHVPGGRICDCRPGFTYDDFSDNCQPLDFCNGPCTTTSIRQGRFGGQPLATSGWFANGQPASMTTCGAYGDILGGVGQFNGTTELLNFFPNLPPHVQLYVRVTLVAIDVWQNETFALFVDGITRDVAADIDSAALTHGADECGLPESDPGIVTLEALFPHTNNTALVMVLTSAYGNASKSWGLLDFHLETFSAGPCHSCSPHATCTSEATSYSCGCNSGFAGNGSSCETMAACSARCISTATCDSFGACTCNPGLVGDGSSCQDAAACSAACFANATCNALGVCTCDPGLLNDGPACVPLTEADCAVCDDNAACAALDGIVTCACQELFFGDGASCAPGACLNELDMTFSPPTPSTNWRYAETSAALTQLTSCPSGHLLSGLSPGLTARTTLAPAAHTSMQVIVTYAVVGSWQGERLSIYVDGVRFAQSEPIHVLPQATEPCGQAIAGQTRLVLKTSIFEHASAAEMDLGLFMDAGLAGGTGNTWALESVQVLLDGDSTRCGTNEQCEGTASRTCSCQSGFEGSPCTDINECAAPACNREAETEIYRVNNQNAGLVASCGGLPPHFGGYGVFSNDAPETAELPSPSSHTSIQLEFHFVLIDNWSVNDTIKLEVDGVVVAQTPPVSSSTGTYLCGHPSIPDPGVVVVTTPILAHNSAVVDLVLRPVVTSAQSTWGLIRHSVIYDPAANPGCNECSKPHMVCSNQPGSSSCACEAGYQLIGSACFDIDECAVQDQELRSAPVGAYEETGWTDIAHGSQSLVAASTCNGVQMLGGFGALGKYSIPERTFRNIAGHSALTVEVTIYAIDSWDGETVTLFVDGASAASLTLTHPAGSSPGCGNAGADVGQVVLSAQMASHSASDVVVRLETDLTDSVWDASYGIVSTVVTLHNDNCGAGNECTNTDGSFTCTCPGEPVPALDGRSCQVGTCSAFDGLEHNGFNLTGCAAGHAEDNPLCVVGCAASTGGVNGTWTCMPGGVWQIVYPVCFDYEPALNATAGSPYAGPPVSLNLDLATTSNLAALVSVTNLDPEDALSVSSDPADFGSISASFSPTAQRSGPIRVQLQVTYDDFFNISQTLEVAAFDIDVAPEMLSAGSNQVAFTGQVFLGQEPEIIGGRPPYSFQIGEGTLPAGFHLNSKGTIVGTASQTGNFSWIVVHAIDVSGATIALEPINFEIITALQLDTSASGLLPTAVAGVEYFQEFNFTTVGGTGPITFHAEGEIPAALTVQAQTGALIGFPLPGSARPEPYLFDIVASDDSGIEVTALVVSLVVEARPDCDDPGNGPNGQGCGTGLCVDLVAFDGAFTCDCSATGLGGDNCQLVIGGDLAASRGSAGASSAVSGSLGALAALVVILAVIALLVRRAQVRARNQPFDFKAELERMQDEGLVVLFAGDGGDGVPREIKRDNIQLLDKLGAGQFGDVFKGTVDESAATGIPAYLVAVKTLKGDPSSWEMTELMREAALMAQFRHRNVVNLVGVCTRGEPYYLVVQFCENGALVDYLKAQKEPLEEAVMMRMAHEIATGMEYLSGAGLVHRDLAARNVLLDSQVVCKVADFGMSRDVATTDKEYYRAGQAGMMPVRWAAPEALDEQLFSQHSDVWAWGITVYEILTRGQTPYEGWSNQKVWVNVKAGHRLACPEGFDEKLFQEVVMPCWDEVPSRRPTFTALCRQLEGLFASPVSGPLGAAAHRNRYERVSQQPGERQQRYSIVSLQYNATMPSGGLVLDNGLNKDGASRRKSSSDWEQDVAGSSPRYAAMGRGSNDVRASDPYTLASAGGPSVPPGVDDGVTPSGFRYAAVDEFASDESCGAQQASGDGTGPAGTTYAQVDRCVAQHDQGGASGASTSSDGSSSAGSSADSSVGRASEETGYLHLLPDSASSTTASEQPGEP